MNDTDAVQEAYNVLVREDLPNLAKELKMAVEKREREAFEAGANACQVAIIQGSQGRETKTLDETYRAYKETQK